MFLANVVFVVIIVLDIIVYYFRRLHQDEEEEDDYVTRNNSSAPSSSSNQHCRRIPLAEIKKATHNFDAGLVIGKGGFGKVYIGNIIIHNGNRETCVAFKRLDLGSSQGAPEFWTEIEMLSNFRHSHLVSLIGYCDEGKEMILVYEYMAGGTLHDHLHKISGASGGSNCPLSWVQRLKICIGAARGLDYLHTGTSIQHRVIHRDVKSSNILLDENLEAKLSDFGLSKLGPANQPSTHVITQVKGTLGYLDPEYFLTRRLTRKSDVYAFGVLLFEVLCGRLAVDTKLDQEQWGLASWAKQCIKEGKLDQITDQTLKGSIRPNCLKVFVQTAEQCLQINSKKRPSMGEIVIRLEHALALQEGLNSSVVEEEIIYTDRDESRDNQENSSHEHSVNNANDGSEEQIDGSRQLGRAGSKQSPIRSSRKMKFMKKVRFLFSAKVPAISAAGSTLVEASSSSGHPDAFRGIIVPMSLEFTHEELAKATNDFSIANKIGQGGFGSVYYAELGSKKVAIKKMEMQASREFLTELKVLTRVHHVNLACLIGYCIEGSLFLVYEFIEKGSLSQHLFGSGREPLPWSTRVQVALDSARGLEYIHEHTLPVFIHCDVKSANILLDKNFHGKIADFGLVKLTEVGSSSLVTRLVGTFGYMPPEYATYGEVSPKVDVYAFGVVLYELISAKEAIFWTNGHTAEMGLVNWFEELLSCPDPIHGLVKIIDPRLGENYPLDSVYKMALLANACTHANPQLRPSMRSVVVALMTLSSTTETWDVATFYGNQALVKLMTGK